MRRLQQIDTTKPHRFITPIKRINEGHDVSHFLTSRAYTDIGTFVMQLNTSMCPRKVIVNGRTRTQAWELGSKDVKTDGIVKELRELLSSVEEVIQEAPPDTGPRRFGNVSFRKWYALIEDRADALLRQHIPATVLDVPTDGETTAMDEIKSYFMGSWGSAQRLDFGTGHELSFLAFLGCLWKLRAFGMQGENLDDGEVERSIVLGVLEPYLNVIRKLVLTYTLEPAGSHGVWGLDDHFFLPYIFGSAQYSPPIGPGDPMPTEGSMPGAPSTNDIMKMSKVDELRQTNMYFSAVGFIYDVKSGPFWEHSPILFDISGVKFGWGKVNKGMVKMYNAEVLSKFPVVQHFYFGSLFSWERDPDALPAETTAHMASQPTHIEAAVPEGISTQRPSHTEALPKVGAGITSGMGMPMTAAPWANSSMPPQVPMAQTRRPAPPEAATKVGFTANPATGMPMTAAPWARSNTTIPPPPNGSNPAATRAPWARPSEDPRLPKR